MVITIDGPAGAGKSSVARKLAQRLGFNFLDTGAMYRALTLAVMRSGVDLHDAESVVEVAHSAEISISGDSVVLNGEDVANEIRSPDVTRNIHYVADVQRVRHRLNAMQRSIAQQMNIVTEGRDQGTEVFVDAECKIFLTASPLERARRRQKQLLNNGKKIAVEDVLRDQEKRDSEDQRREMGALRAAPDAYQMSTDGMEEPAVVDQLAKIAQEAISAASKR